MSKAASFNPETFSEGGLIDNFVAELKNCRFEMFSYKGKFADTPCFTMDMIDTETGEQYEQQYWSVGASKDWLVDSDGQTVIPNNEDATIKKSSNFGLLLISMVNAGFPPDKLGEKAGDFNGMIAHFHRAAAPKRGTIGDTKTDSEGKEQKMTILEIDEIQKFPWEKGKDKGGKASGNKKKTSGSGGDSKKGKKDGGKDAKSVVPDEAVKDKATLWLLERLADAGEGVPAKKLPTEIMRAHLKDPDRDALVQVIHSSEFLSGDEAWTYEDGMVTLAE